MSRSSARIATRACSKWHVVFQQHVPDRRFVWMLKLCLISFGSAYAKNQVGVELTPSKKEEGPNTCRPNLLISTNLMLIETSN
jgi:hypothetical protein